MAETRERRPHEWDLLSKQRIAMAKAINEVCRRCGKPMDYELKGTHRWGATTDHEL